MLKPFRKITVTEEKLTRLAIPADKGLRLRTSDRGAYSYDRPERIRSIKIRQLPIGRPPCRFHKVAHLKCRRPPARASVRLVRQRANGPPAYVGKPVQRRDLGADTSLLRQPMIDETSAERIRQRIGKCRRKSFVLAARQIGKRIRLSAKRHHQRRNLKTGLEKLAVVLKSIRLAARTYGNDNANTLSP